MKEKSPTFSVVASSLHFNSALLFGLLKYFSVVDKCLLFHTRNPAKASGGRPYETGSRNMAATKKMNFLTLVSYSLLQTLFH